MANFGPGFSKGQVLQTADGCWFGPTPLLFVPKGGAIPDSATLLPNVPQDVLANYIKTGVGPENIYYVYQNNKNGCYSDPSATATLPPNSAPDLNAFVDQVNPNNLGPITITADSAPPQDASGGNNASPTTAAVVTNGFCGGEFRISTEICNSVFPAVAFDQAGDIGIVWHDTRDGNFEIYCRFLQSQLDASQLKIAQGFSFDPATGKAINLSCSGFSTMSSFSGANIPLVTQGGGQLDVNPNSQTMVLTAGPGSKDFQSLGVTANSSVSILNGINSGKTFYVLRLLAPNLAELIFSDTAKADADFTYSITRADSGSSTAEVRLTCNKGASQFPDIVADSKGRFHIVFQDNSNGNYELYYTLVYPASVGLPDCTGLAAPISSIGFSPVPNGTPGSIVITPPPNVLVFTGSSLVSFPITGADGAFFSFGNKALPDSIPNENGSILSRTGLHRLFKDFGGDGNWIGVSKAPDRDTWNAQAFADGVTVAPDYVAGIGNAFAAPGDFGTKFNFRDVAFIAQTPPDKDVSITQVALPLKPRCLPPSSASASNPTPQNIQAAPKIPVPPGFQDPVDLAEILQSPLVSIDNTIPPRFTVQGDNSGTVFTNIVTDNGQGQLNRFVFTCSTASAAEKPIFILGQLECGTELCALFPDDTDSVTGAVNPIASAQYKAKLQIWQGPDYRFVPNQIASAQFQNVALLVEKEFAFDPGESINVFQFKPNEVVAKDGQFLFFVIQPEAGVEFYIEGVGGGHEIWSTNGDGTFDQYYVPFTIHPNSGLDLPVYYEGYLRPATSGVQFFPPGTQLDVSCANLAANDLVDIFFGSDQPGNAGVQSFDPVTGIGSGRTFFTGTDASGTPIQYTIPSLSQGFVVTSKKTLVSVSVYSAGIGTAIATIYAADANGLPTGPAIASGSAEHGLFLGSEASPVNIPICVELDPGNYAVAFRSAAVSFGHTIVNKLPVNALLSSIQQVYRPSPGATPFFDIFDTRLNFFLGPPDTVTILNGQPVGNAGSVSTTGGAGTCWTMTIDDFSDVAAVPIGATGTLNVSSGSFSTPVPTVPAQNIFGTFTLLAANPTAKTMDIQITTGSVTRFVLAEAGTHPFIVVFSTGTSSQVVGVCSSILPNPLCPSNPSAPTSPNAGTPPSAEPLVNPAFNIGGSGDISKLIALPPVRITQSSGDSVHPRLAIDANDIIWLAFHSDRVGNNEVYVCRNVCGQWASSANGGVDFQISNAGANGKDAQFPNIALDDLGNAHVAWHSTDTEDGQPDIFYARSTSGGDLFNAPQRISASKGKALMPSIAISSNLENANSTGCQGKTETSTLASSGQITIVWHDNRYGQFEVMAATKIGGIWNSSAQGTNDTRITQAPGDSLYPRIASDHHGNLRCVYHDFRRGISNPWIFMSTFVAANRRWDSTGQAGVDMPVSPTGTASSLFPDIDIDPLDGVYVVWHDTRFHTAKDSDTQEEIMGTYCSRLDAPVGYCGPICTNVEAFVTTIVNIVDPVTNKPIETTNIPQVGVQITSPGATFYRISENGMPFSAWQPFQPGTDLDTIVAQWVLSAGAGLKKLCVQVQDSTTVGFPVCKSVTLQSSLPQFRIGFYQDIGLTVPLNSFQNHPVAPEGNIYIKISSTVPLVEAPTFDVVSRGVRLVFNQQTASISGFSASINQLKTIVGNVVSQNGVSGFSAIAGTDFIGRFHVDRDDGFFHIDGPARVIPHGTDIRGQSF